MDEESSSLSRSQTPSHAEKNSHPSQQHLPQMSKWKARRESLAPQLPLPKETVSLPAPPISLLHCCLITSEIWLIRQQGKAANRHLTALSYSTSVYPLDLHALK